MEQKEKVVDEQIVEIEQSICDFFALTYEDVFSKKLKRDLVLARHFTIYILHKKYNIPTNKLSKRYRHDDRHILRICSEIHFSINHDKKYRNYYSCLMQYMKKGE